MAVAYRLLGCIGLVLAWGLCAAARAQSPDARTVQAQGEAYFEAENYDAALVEFQRLYSLLEGHPSRYLVLFNVGQCQERLFRYDDALRSYQGYLDEGGPDAEDRATVEATVRALDGMLATLTIETNATDAEVWVDDRRLGAAPGRVRVPPGNHSVEIRAPQFSPGRQEVVLATHASQTLTFTLEPLGEGGGVHPAFFLTGSAVTVAVLGIAIGFGIDAMMTSSQVSRLAGSSNPAEWGSVYEEDRLRIGRLALTADVLYAVAGTLAIGSFVMLLVTDWDGSEAAAAPPASAWVVPFVGDGQAGLAAAGRF